MHAIVQAVTDRIIQRSEKTRRDYLDKCARMREQQPIRKQLSCSNFAHAVAGCSVADKQILRFGDSANIGIVSAYNDMLSAHQPYRDYPALLSEAIAALGSIAQMAGGVPAMCDGITQGNAGMELSLFSRDVIAMSTAIALTHNAFDGALLLGICDKIVPGLLIGALSFGHLPALFVPAGPMPSGISNAEKVRLRQEYAAGRIGEEALLEVEMQSYHSPGTCTFYGTANSNQVLLECMGLLLPGSAFINPGTPLRTALSRAAAQRITQITALGNRYSPLSEIVSEKSIVNAIVGLLATGGSSNHTLHWVTVARAAGIVIDWSDFSDLAKVTPLLASVYPNGAADINAFQHAGGTAVVIRELLAGGFMHGDVRTVVGDSLHDYTRAPTLNSATLEWHDTNPISNDGTVVRPLSNPFFASGGLRVLSGNCGRAIIKTSAIKAANHVVEAPARVFSSQEDFVHAYQRGELNRDVVVVLAYQGPKFNGMPELHKLIPFLANLLDLGFNVGLVTDGRLSGASGKVPAAIHVTPEACEGGVIGKLRDGDMIRIDVAHDTLSVLVADSELEQRRTIAPSNSQNETYGRDLFGPLRRSVGSAEQGASIWSAQ